MESVKRKRDSNEEPADSPHHLPKYVRMQDVVKLPYPLTWLWRSSEYAVQEAISTGVGSNRTGQSTAKPQHTALTTVCDNQTTPRYTSARKASAPLFSTPVDKVQPTRSSRFPHEFESTDSAQPAIDSKASTPVPNSTPAIKPPRYHTMKNRNFEAGTLPMPQDIQDLHSLIRSCQCHNKSGLWVRSDLRKKVPEHFAAVTGYLRAASTLNVWLGDTRLFTREEWYYLKGWSREEGRKGGGGEVNGAEKVLRESDAKNVEGGDSDADGWC